MLRVRIGVDSQELSSHAPSAINHAPSTINHQPCTMHHAPCTMHHAPSTINHSPSTINHQQCTISHQPSTINHQPSTINHAQELRLHQPCTQTERIWHATKGLQFSCSSLFSRFEVSIEMQASPSHTRLPYLQLHTGN
jgi:hypothetical protein